MGILLALVASFLVPPGLIGRGARLTSASLAVEAADGRLLRAFAAPDGQMRLPVSVDAVDPNFLRLLIAYEDKRFDRHWGVDFLAIARAMRQNFGAGRVVSGGSTLTMQVARLMDPGPRTLWRKGLEIHRALRLELFHSKREILDLYLRLAPYGGNIAGLRTASLQWLGKEPAHLTLAESALLIALPQSPNRARPDRDGALARQSRDKVLRQLATTGVIGDADLAVALADPLPRARESLPFHAPHLAERLARAHGPGKSPVIRTTIDFGLQRILEDAAARALPALDPEASIALILAESDTGAVRALVGGGDYFSLRRRGAVDMSEAVRSPGSTLKPFIYAMAFDDAIARPETIIRDAPVKFGDYEPGNFEGGFAGDVSFAEALQLSLNIPAVKILDAIGPERFAARLREGGAVLRWPEGHSRAGLPLALGGVGLRLSDLVQLYLALDGGGVAPGLHVDTDRPARKPARLMSAAAAGTVAHILAGAPTPPGVAPAADRQRFAFKTGTSYGFRDAWALGAGGGWTLGVLVARADATPIPDQFGRAAAAPVLFRTFNLLPVRAPARRAVPDSPRTGTSGPDFWRGDRYDRTSGREGLRIVFPDPGTLVNWQSLAAGEGGTSLVLIAAGGRKPYHWLVNGRAVESEPFGDSAEWHPDGPGAVAITLVDANGEAAAADIWLK